jgi:hypothetical protein
MQAPSFFLSSTIHDFRDLRSALKYYLEQQGCMVRASEYNDFPKPLNVHSYDACLKAIEGSDYFVLLIGGRVGGRVDGPDGESITQMEYRHAYRLHKEGRLKLLLFVRDEIWTLKDDRTQLARHLAKDGMSSAEQVALQAYNGKVLEDAGFLISFVDEIARAAEARAASKGNGVPPTGNWVHTFRTFADVVDVLQTQAFAARPVDEAALRVLLVRELSALLKRSLGKIGEQTINPAPFLARFRRDNQIPKRFVAGTEVPLQTKSWNELWVAAMCLLGWRFDAPVLERALSASAFLEFDRESGTLRETPLFDLLYKLRDQLDRMRLALSAETLATLYKYSAKSRGGRDMPVAVDAAELFTLLHLLDRWSDVIELASAAIVALRSGLVVPLDLRGPSPLDGMAEQLEKEKPTADDIEVHLSEFVSARAPS